MYYTLSLVKSLLYILVVGCTQRTDDMEIMFNGTRGALYKLCVNIVTNKT